MLPEVRSLRVLSAHMSSTLTSTLGGQEAPSLADPATTANLSRPPTVYGVHSVGVFLPWHRYAIWTFESVLRSECNYTGAQPYWDWTLDNPSANGSMTTSPIIKSFGGNGSDPSGCVLNGPFNDPTFLNIGPVESLAKNPRCMTRNLNEDLFNGGSNWNDIYPPLISRRSHVQVQQFIDGLSFVAENDTVATGAFINPHSLGHMAIGGDVSIRSSLMTHRTLTLPSSRISMLRRTIPSSGPTTPSSTTCGLFGRSVTRRGWLTLAGSGRARVPDQAQTKQRNSRRSTLPFGWAL